MAMGDHSDVKIEQIRDEGKKPGARNVLAVRLAASLSIYI